MKKRCIDAECFEIIIPNLFFWGGSIPAWKGRLGKDITKSFFFSSASKINIAREK
jgi:hypothetical protein